MRDVKTVWDRLKGRLDAQFKILVRNSSWVFLGSVVRTVSVFVKSILIARGLGVELYGHYVLIVAFVGAVEEFFNLNIGAAVIKFGADYRTEGNGSKLVALVKAGLWFCAGLTVVSVLVTSAVLVVAYDAILDTPGLEVYILAYAVAAGTTYFNSMSDGLLRLYFRFRVNAVVGMVLSGLELVLIGLVCVLYPHQLAPFLVVTIATTLAGGLLLNGAAFWELRPELGPYRRAGIGCLRGERKEIGSFVFCNSAGRTVGTLLHRGDVLVLGALSTAEQVGLYEIAKKLAYTVLRLTDPLGNSIFPQVASLAARRRLKEMRAMLARVVAALGIPGVLLLAGAFVTGPWWIVQLYGAAFAPAAAPFLVHLMAALLTALLFWVPSVIVSFGKVQLRLLVATAGLVVGLGLAVGLAPAFGAVGVAVASAVAKTLVLGALTAVAYRLIRTPAHAERALRPLPLGDEPLRKRETTV